MIPRKIIVIDTYVRSKENVPYDFLMNHRVSLSHNESNFLDTYIFQNEIWIKISKVILIKMTLVNFYIDDSR